MTEQFTEAVEFHEVHPPLTDGGVSAPEPQYAAAPTQASTSRRGWRRLLPRSLASRLVAWVVGLVIVIVAATGTATYVALHSFLYNRLDQQLTATASSDSVQQLFAGASGLQPPALRSPQEVWAVILYRSGAVLPVDSNGAYNVMQLAADDRQSLATKRPTKPVSIQTTDGVTLRAVTRDVSIGLPNGLHIPGLAVVGLSTAEVERTLDRLLYLELAIGAGAILLAGLVTTWGVRVSLRPLRRVTSTAREVTAEMTSAGTGLDRRVPETDPDTEVGQLAESFNTLLDTVETEFAARVASEERMRQFLADASHELRTPLTSIRGYAELARLQGGPAAEDDTLRRIESEGTRMSRLVDDLLLLARSDRGAQPARDRVYVTDLVEDAVEGAEAAYPDRRIDAAVPPGVVITGDYDQLLRALRNLITNACVHTAPGGPIEVRALIDASMGDVVLQVQDAGPGLTPEAASHVFERFWRADKARSRVRGGTGLGLAIVQSIVEAHGGSVRFDSDVATGSTVTVRLPAYAAAPRQEAPVDVAATAE